jgi:hypothetical protein
MHPFYLILSLLLAFQTSVFAQDATSGKSLAEEFSKLESYLKNRALTPEQKKKNLEGNLLSSLRMTLGHKLENPRKDLKDLKIQDVQSERFSTSNQFFVKYKAYYISYVFPVDPEIYQTSPYEEKILEKPEGADLLGAHSDEKK